MKPQMLACFTSLRIHALAGATMADVLELLGDLATCGVIVDLTAGV
jgi:hypothetical protein